MNLSIQTDSETARTSAIIAEQRAANLAVLEVRSVIELCVGPSLATLEKAYAAHGIVVTGNDIDRRWKKYHPTGKWIIGDARSIDTTSFDAVVVAPPLSRGCSGKRDDSLPLDRVVPSYYDFLSLPNPIVVFVLPGRTLSVKQDRRELHRFLSHLKDRQPNVVPLREKKVVKYVDVYTESPEGWLCKIRSEVETLQKHITHLDRWTAMKRLGHGRAP